MTNEEQLNERKKRAVKNVEKYFEYIKKLHDSVERMQKKRSLFLEQTLERIVLISPNKKEISKILLKNGPSRGFRWRFLKKYPEFKKELQ